MSGLSAWFSLQFKQLNGGVPSKTLVKVVELYESLAITLFLRAWTSSQVNGALRRVELRVPVTRSICCLLAYEAGLIGALCRLKGVALKTRRTTRVTLFWVGTSEPW